MHAGLGEPSGIPTVPGVPASRTVVVVHDVGAPVPGPPGELIRGYRAVLAGSATVDLHLAELGLRGVERFAPVLDPVPITHVGADEPTAHHLAVAVEGPLVLACGSLDPAGRPELVVEAHHVLVTYSMPSVNLVLVGPAPDAAHSAALRHLVHQLELRGCWLAGPVGLPELAAFLARADAVVNVARWSAPLRTPLDPLVAGVPVVTRSGTSLAESSGDAAVVLPADAGPLLVAEAMDAVLTESDLRRRLVDAGRRRVEATDLTTAREQLASRILEL
ncbi:MAG: glycosyltransferase [Acidimicrobiia bacterium]|nr:glycosyltransferase [Acidimicrobiia bacterium]